MNKNHLWWIIPLSMFFGILLWEIFIRVPESNKHWDLTFACMRELYNLTMPLR